MIVQSNSTSSTKTNDPKASNSERTESTEQYTYEGAIEDYRSRIRSKIHLNDSMFTKKQDCNATKSKEFSEAQTALPKGEIFKRKELFESDKTVEISNYESPTSRRLSEDFVNTQSIKQRLQSLEKCTDQSLTNSDKSDVQTIKQRLQHLNQQNDDLKTENNKARPANISSYLVEKSNSIEEKTIENDTDWKSKHERACSSPEAELYMDNLKMFSKDLDTLMYGKSTNNGLGDYCVNANYPASTSSTELMGISSDREDSGIHTADVSCSVSQADEPVEDVELAATTIPNCIEKLITEEQIEKVDETNCNGKEISYVTSTELAIDDKNDKTETIMPSKQLIDSTIKLLESLQKDSSENMLSEKEINIAEEPKSDTKKKTELKPQVYENVVLDKPVDFISSDVIIMDPSFPLAPLKTMEPPRMKPPPPPPPAEDTTELPDAEMNRRNSTKRIKREIHIKRSSFLGLDEPTVEQIYPEITIDKPPNIESFLRKESKYKKNQEDDKLGVLSKVESHDSGLDIDRGRLSSDTWCSSIGDSTTPSPERQDSEVKVSCQ